MNKQNLFYGFLLVICVIGVIIDRTQAIDIPPVPLAITLFVIAAVILYQQHNEINKD